MKPNVTQIITESPASSHPTFIISIIPQALIPFPTNHHRILLSIPTPPSDAGFFFLN